MKFNTKTIHGGQEHDPATGAVMPPIYQTSTYAQSSPGKHKGYEYSRAANPTRTALENNFAAIENGTHGFAFSSGLSAIDCVLKMLNPGDEIIANDDLYGGTYRMFTRMFEKYGLKFHFVNMEESSNVEELINKDTKLIWIETPTNPLMKIADIKEIAALTKAINKDILVAVDNTFATPYLQLPLDLGADIVMHSATKYLGGHSDILAGAVACSQEHIDKIWCVAKNLGGSLSDFMVWMLERSIKTLVIRVKEQNRNAKKLARFLNKNEDVKTVYYPGLKSHPDYELAKQQMRGFGGMISFELNEGLDAPKFLKSLKMIKPSMSLAGVESSMLLPAQTSHALISQKERDDLGIGNNLIRFSVGIESPKDIKDDIEQAIASVKVDELGFRL